MRIAEFLGLAGKPSHTRGAATSFRKPIALCHSLMSERGDVSGSRLAAEALDAYQALDAPGRRRFFEALVREFSPDPEQVGRAGDAYRHAPSPENLARLQQVVEPPRQELFRRLNSAPDGTRLLVWMRGHVLEECAHTPDLKPVAADLTHLFASWFNRGFLALRRIDWHTSAVILEKFIRYDGLHQYDAVHQVHGWHDLRRRLEVDRRCYAFFHPALPEEPFIFFEVALTRELPEKFQPLLDPGAPLSHPKFAEWAVFFPLTNCQEGLRGVSFGSFLIKQVIEDLSQELPRIRNFATLSPIPGLRKWLGRNVPEAISPLDDPGWMDDPATAADMQRSLMPAAAYYLLRAKHNGEPADPVARFHFQNGARLERINWLGDTSAAGLARSAGLTVNYVYKLADLERNHDAYVREGKLRAVREIESLARRFLPPARS